MVGGNCFGYPILHRIRWATLSLFIFLNVGDYSYGQKAIAQSGVYSGKVVLCGTQRKSDPLRRIELLDPVSLKLQELHTFDKEVPIALSISPNGKYLAVTATLQEGDRDKAQLILVDSEKQTRVIAEDVMVVAWSPDETQLLVRGGKNYEWSNSVIELETGLKEKLPLPATDAVMDWSSGGDVLSVMAGRPEKIFEQRPGEFYPKRQLYIFNLEKKVAEDSITPPDEDCIKGRFSNDGNELAYSRRTYSTGKPVELCEILHLESRKHRTIIDFTSLGVRPNLNPLWSRDGKQLLWQVSREQDDKEQWELWFLPTDGSAHQIVGAKDLGLEFFGVMDWR